MRNKVFVGTVLGIILFFGSFILLFWGPSLIVARANRLFSINDIDKARQVYLRLAKLNPKSPEIGYNLGLCDYQLGELETARHRFEDALANMETRPKFNLFKFKNLLLVDMIQYHLGNIAFKSAIVAKGEPFKLKLYEVALIHYKKAIQANPQDMEAKYNYELVLLRLSQNQGGAAAQKPSEALNQTASQGEEYLNHSTSSELLPEGNDW